MNEHREVEYCVAISQSFPDYTGDEHSLRFDMPEDVVRADEKLVASSEDEHLRKMFIAVGYAERALKKLLEDEEDEDKGDE